MRYREKVNIQLQQRSVGTGVAKLLLALLLKICFQGTNSLGIVALKAVDDAGDVVRSLGWVLAVHCVDIEGYTVSRGKCARGEDGDGGAKGSFRRFV